LKSRDLGEETGSSEPHAQEWKDESGEIVGDQWKTNQPGSEIKSPLMTPGWRRLANWIGSGWQEKNESGGRRD
jgi:hypothetical protein